MQAGNTLCFFCSPTTEKKLEPQIGQGEVPELPGVGRRVQGRRICPSLGVRDELTAQLLFQLHGLFENNVMSFITDNPGKWLLWQPRKRMAIASQSEVPTKTSVCTNSLYSTGRLPSSARGGGLGGGERQEQEKGH